MRSKNNIINWYGMFNSSYLHPGGKNASKLLHKYINSDPQSNILEIGFGVGETLIELAKQNENHNFYGIDINPIMYKKTLKKIKSRKIKNVQIQLVKIGDKPPFHNIFFDTIYIESVLAINDIKTITSIFKDIKSILKKEGKVLINEGIWRNNISLNEIEEINKITLKHFGILQANSDIPYCKDWINFFESQGFKVLESYSISKNCKKRSYKDSLKNGLIKLFHKKGFNKIKNQSNFLTGYIFVLRN